MCAMFHASISTCVFPRMYFHETCTLHTTSKHGLRKHVMGRQYSILVVPHEITHVKMKLQLSGTIYRITLEHAQKHSDTIYNGVCFTGLCTSISSTRFISDLFHHLRLVNKVSQQ